MTSTAAPAFPARGRIGEHHLASVLLALLHEGRDGCLTVTRGRVTRRLYLRGGMIVYSSSTKRADRLGEILVAQGKLTRDELRRYWDESRSGSRKLGITLVLNGVITLSDLYQAVAAQVVTILDRLQKMRSGEYEFEEGRRPAPGTVLLRIPLALYLRAGARQRGAAGEALVVGEADLALGVTISFEKARRLESIGEVSFLVQELRRRRGLGPHALLGVPADAAPDAVQAACERIAAVLAPDRLPADCSPGLVRDAGDIFREVTEAGRAASGEPGRGERAESPPPPQRVVTKAEEDPSRRFYAVGRDWLARRNYWQAADALRQAVRLKPGEAAYRYHLGMALIQTRRLPEAEEHLVEATRLEPENPVYLVALGRLYRAGRIFRKAREAFQRAQRLDPANRQAREELADLPEGQPGEHRGDSGLFRKIFGKG
jgi:tetratricopeptide (TPR) repeat protein